MNDLLLFRPDAAGHQGATSWELDEHTRDIGRQGLAAARQALRASGRKAA